MINGGSYEDGHHDYDNYTDDGSEHYDSPNRERDRKHRHRHSSRHHRHRRKRSRSRSRSRERAAGKVHINPNFAPTLGPTASSLLETNNILEAEVVSLRNEISCTGIRIRALENELSNGTLLRGNLEQELSSSRMNCQKLQQAAAKNAQVLCSLRAEATGLRKEKDRLAELLKQSEMQLSANIEQVSFLMKRNETLGKKCEELVEKNKILREERDDAAQLATSMKREVENMQATIDLRLLEYKRMESDLATARERERMWKIEKLELERKLTSKDSQLSAERKKAEEQRKRDKAQLEVLEKKLKSEQPGWESQLGVEAVFRAIDVVKKEFQGQLQVLQEEMRPLKEQGCAIASYQMNAVRPPRVLSAPPLSSAGIPSSSYVDIKNQDVNSNPAEEEQPAVASQSNESGGIPGSGFQNASGILNSSMNMTTGLHHSKIIKIKRQPYKKKHKLSFENISSKMIKRPSLDVLLHNLDGFDENGPIRPHLRRSDKQSFCEQRVESCSQNGILPTFTEQELIDGDDEMIAASSDPVLIDEAALLDD